MLKFRVDCGSYGREGRVFKRGDIVTCSEDLTKTFPNSFIKIGPEDEAASPAVDSEDDFELDKGPDDVLKGKALSGSETPDDRDDDTEPSKKKKSSKGKGSQASRKGKGKSTKDSRGRDVTSKFPHAKDEDFLVFRRGSGYFVHDTDDPDKPMNAKALKKSKVDAFIDQTLEI